MTEQSERYFYFGEDSSNSLDTQNRKKTSPIFQYYTAISHHRVTCNLCTQINKQTVFSIRHSIYKNAQVHLQREHNIKIEPRKNRKKSIPIKVIKHSQQERLVDMICNYGISFKTIDQCNFFTTAFKALRIEKPTNSQDIIMKEIKIMREQMNKEFKHRKNMHEIFSLSYSIIQNLTRDYYISICLHLSDGNCKNIGISRLPHNPNQEQIEHLIRMKLSLYGLDLKRDILAICCNATDSNFNFCKEIAKQGLFCLASGLHEAVNKFLYRRPVYAELISDSDIEQNSQEYAFDKLGISQQFTSWQVSMAVSKVRRLIFQIKKDQVLELHLKEVAYQKYRKELILDCRMKWTSLFLMIERFIELLPEIEIVLRGSERIFLTNGQKQQIYILVTLLRHVSCCLFDLQNNTMNISSAYQSYQQLVSGIQRINNPQADDLLANVKQVFETRMNLNLYLVLQYFTGKISTLTENNRTIIKDFLDLMINTNQSEQNDYYDDQNLKNMKQENSMSLLDKFTLIAKGSHYKRIVSPKFKSSDHLNVQQKMEQFEKYNKKCQIFRQIESGLNSMPVTICQSYRNLVKFQWILNSSKLSLNEQIIEDISILFKQSKLQIDSSFGDDNDLMGLKIE